MMAGRMAGTPKVTAELRFALERRIQEKPELSHGEHRYQIANYGMTEAQAREPFDMPSTGRVDWEPDASLLCLARTDAVTWR